MPRGLCVNCQRKIRRGIRCYRCVSASGTAWRDPPIGIALMGLRPRGQSPKTIFGAPTLAEVLRWIAQQASRRHRLRAGRRWIEKCSQPARVDHRRGRQSFAYRASQFLLAQKDA